MEMVTNEESVKYEFVSSSYRPPCSQILSRVQKFEEFGGSQGIGSIGSRR